MVDGDETVNQIRTLLAARIETIERDLHLYGEQEKAIQLSQAELGRERVRLLNVLKALDGEAFKVGGTGGNVPFRALGYPFAELPEERR